MSKVVACLHCGKETVGRFDRTWCSIFCKFVHFVGPMREDGCVDWAGTVYRSTGYGMVEWTPSDRAHLTRKGAHVMSWSIVNGMDVPRGLLVRHACDRPICVAPWHLSIGTTQDNSNDAKERNRMARGSRHSQAKLTEDAIPKMRAMREGGATYIAIGEAFGVTKDTARLVCLREVWAHV